MILNNKYNFKYHIFVLCIIKPINFQAFLINILATIFMRHSQLIIKHLTFKVQKLP